MMMKSLQGTYHNEIKRRKKEEEGRGKKQQHRDAQFSYIYTHIFLRCLFCVPVFSLGINLNGSIFILLWMVKLITNFLGTTLLK